jgi:hypothetical protein
MDIHSNVIYFFQKLNKVVFLSIGDDKRSFASHFGGFATSQDALLAKNQEKDLE